MKITRKENFRVIVEPRSLGDFGFGIVSDRMGRTEEQCCKEYLERCEEIEQDIKRHVNNVGHVYVKFDKEEICSYCGYGWEESEGEEDFEKGSLVCCEEAMEEWKNKLSNAKLKL